MRWSTASLSLLLLRGLSSWLQRFPLAFWKNLGHTSKNIHRLEYRMLNFLHIFLRGHRYYGGLTFWYSRLAALYSIRSSCVLLSIILCTCHCGRLTAVVGSTTLMIKAVDSRASRKLRPQKYCIGRCCCLCCVYLHFNRLEFYLLL